MHIPRLLTLRRRHITIDMGPNLKINVLSTVKPMQMVNRIMNFNSMMTSLGHFSEECPCMAIVEEMFTRILSYNIDIPLEVINTNSKAHKLVNPILDSMPSSSYSSLFTQLPLYSNLALTTPTNLQESTNTEQKHQY